MKAKVPLHGRMRGRVIVDTKATEGAVVGVNLRWADGSLVRVSDFGGAAVDENPNGAVSRTLWSLVAQIPVNVQAVAGLSSDGFVRKAGDVWTASAIVNADLAGASTTGLAEGSNLYYTQARADARVSAGIAAHVALPDPHAQYALESSLAAVATSGAYADLSGVPAFGTAAESNVEDFDAAGAASSAQAAAEAYADGLVLDSIGDGDTTHAPSRNAVFDALALKVNTADVGVANGVAPLASDGKIDSAYLPTATVGQVVYQGTWDASAGTAPSGTPAKGWYYIVDVAGTTNLDGITDWQVGDWAIHNGTVWNKVDNTDAVSSVAGLTGPVSAASLKTALALVAADVGLGSVDDTADLDKPVSTAQQTAIDAAKNRANHTGTQLASTISNFAATVRAVTLTGLSTATSAVITATDTVLSALGKLQAQISANTTAIAAKVGTSRAINTTAPLTGGGDLSADRTIAISPATTSAAGSMSAADKTKLDGLGGAYGTYTPTITAGANASSASASTPFRYSQSGNQWHVYGFMTINPVSSGLLTAAMISLPPAAGAVDLTSTSQCIGTGCAINTNITSNFRVTADTTADQASVQGTANTSAAMNVAVHFTFDT